MERRPGNIAWAVLAGGIAAYDMLAPEGETMSEAVDRAIEKHPLLTIATVGTVALHLLNVLPNSVDPLHQLAKRVTRQISP